VTVSVRPATQYVRPSPGTRAVSYLSDGRQVVWEPRDPCAGGLAVDAELLSQSVPPALATRFAPKSRLAFFVAWTQAECTAKLLSVPVLVWLREHGLRGDPHLRLRTILCRDIVITIGRSERNEVLGRDRRGHIESLRTSHRRTG
jgi:hypothetical protein